MIKALPRAKVIVPFRDPVSHALSLKRQHELFCELSRKDPFVAEYMEMLGHFEFGPRKKAFFEDFVPSSENDSLNAWLHQWLLVHEHLYRVALQLEASCLFVSHERLRSFPQEICESLSEELGLECELNHTSIRGEEKIEIPKGLNQNILERARQVYEELKEHSL